jgi:hypothetical protein
MKNPIHLSITLNLADYLQNLAHITVTCQSQHSPHQFQFEALSIDKGLRVLDLQITNPANQPISFTTAANLIHIPASDFHITYTVQTEYAVCVGADMDVELVYPFMNVDEIFLGSGIIAHPSPLRDLETDIQVTLNIENLPSNWNLISNFIGDSISPATLDGFFLYAAPQLALSFHTYNGHHQSVTFRFASQYAKSIPITTQELWQFIDTCLNWMEAHLAPYQQVPEINILILQAPADFQSIAQRPTFATGENVLNGIITYGPDNPSYFQRLFGYTDYKTFLLDGIAHELMHTYTTTSWQGKYKAVLVPTADCPPSHARLLGEALNLYFHRQILYRYMDGSTDRFFTETLTQTLNRQRQRPRKDSLLDLFLFDAHLRGNNSSLLVLLSAMLKQKQQTPTPYESAAWLFDILRDQLGITASNTARDLLLADEIPDYLTLLPLALAQFGFQLTESDSQIQITPHGTATFQFDLT